MPRVTFSARGPNVCLSRAAISSAALLVKVTAQMRSGGISSFVMRWTTRPMRQNVFPAPGPAMTRTGPISDSMARRWAASGG